jgi:asparagine synthetase B (glutamine-hydrolysing)
MSTTISIAQELRMLVDGAVEDALNTEAKVGMSLSGGIDSSTIYCLSGRYIPCFTGYYEGAEYDERFFARQVAGIEHHEILITPDDFIEHFDDMVRAAHPPYQGPGTFGQYMVAKYASEHVHVMLSGEGGDELFGGYARLLIVAGEPRPDGYEDYKLPDDYPTPDQFATQEEALAAALAWDYARLPDLLAVDDQMLSAFNVEAVAPFTDPRVVNFVLDLAPELRIGKMLLKEAMRGTVPDVILERTDKRGFPTPFVAWSQGPIAEFVYDRLGYLPDPERPWARDWWVELCEVSRDLLA